MQAALVSAPRRRMARWSEERSLEQKAEGDGWLIGKSRCPAGTGSPPSSRDCWTYRQSLEYFA
eukprot:4815582-Amphidinium_carterae.1